MVEQVVNFVVFRIRIQLGHRIRTGNPDPDPYPGRPKLAPKYEKRRNLMFEESERPFLGLKRRIGRVLKKKIYDKFLQILSQ
jgi:hypothetical protein